MSTTERAQAAWPAYLTQLELARRWGISPRSLEKWRTQRVGPAYIKIGGRVRYPEADIIDFEERQRRGRR